MAKEFSFKEARKLIVFYKKFLERLLKAIGYPSAKLKDIKHKFSRLKFSGYFSNLANHEIEGNEYIEKKDSFETLLLHIDSYIKGVGLAASCDDFCNDNYLEIKSRLNKLSPAGNPILWIFTSKKKKTKLWSNLTILKIINQIRLLIMLSNCFLISIISQKQTLLMLNMITIIKENYLLTR